ncbi:TadE/TadG family type IV pilus assembly protein [Nocardiopsis sp. CA-288880]|uniref:TadE/TadG family type IV pilus assembly protein n=1 Tax=Nocardiopsis sp. CA-288880 TaxID=3239995 RepID=UPI003D997E06
MAVAAPMLLLLVLLVVQTALWMHGDHVAADIARRTAEQSRTAGGGTTVADGGGSFLSGLDVSVNRTAQEVRVVVDAEVPSIIPGFSWPVGHEVTAPVERFVPAEAAP